MKAHYLQVDSWVGLLSYAEHHYGRVTQGGKKLFDVSYSLSRADAARINKEAQRLEGASAFRYSPGETSIRFPSEERLIARAIEMCEQYPEVKVLVKGCSGVLDPMPVLVGPDSLKQGAESIVARAEANDWWEGDEEVMEGLYEEWCELLKAHGVTL